MKPNICKFCGHTDDHYHWSYYPDGYICDKCYDLIEKLKIVKEPLDEIEINLRGENHV